MYGNRVAGNLNEGMDTGDAFTKPLGDAVDAVTGEIADDYRGHGGGLKGAVLTAGENLAQGFLGLPALVGEAGDFIEGTGRGIVDLATTGKGNFARNITEAQGGRFTDAMRGLGHDLAGVVESRPFDQRGDPSPAETPPEETPRLTQASPLPRSATEPGSGNEITSRNIVEDEFGDPTQVDLQTQQGSGSVAFQPGGGLSQAMARARDGKGGGTFSVLDGTEGRANRARLADVLSQGQRMINERGRNEQIRRLTKQVRRGGKNAPAAAQALDTLTGERSELAKNDTDLAVSVIAAKAAQAKAQGTINSEQEKQVRSDFAKIHEDKKGGAVFSRALVGDTPAKLAADETVNTTLFSLLVGNKYGFLSDAIPDPQQYDFRKALRYDAAAGTLWLDPEIESRKGGGLLFDTALDVSDLFSEMKELGVDKNVMQRYMSQLTREIGE
jgi:hypothetical protein